MMENPYKRQAYLSGINFGNELWNMYQAKTLVNTKGNEAFIDRVTTVKKNNKKRDIFNVLDKMKEVQKNVNLSKEQKSKELFELKKELNTVKTNVILDGSEPKQVIDDAIDIYAKQTPELYNYLFVSSNLPFEQTASLSTIAVSKLKEAKEMLKSESNSMTTQNHDKFVKELNNIQKSLQNSLLTEDPKALKENIKQIDDIKAKILVNPQNVNTSLANMQITSQAQNQNLANMTQQQLEQQQRQFEAYIQHLQSMGVTTGQQQPQRQYQQQPSQAQQTQVVFPPFNGHVPANAFPVASQIQKINTPAVQEVFQDEEGKHYVESKPWGEGTTVMDYDESFLQELNQAPAAPRAPSRPSSRAEDIAERFISYVGLNPNNKQGNIDELLKLHDDVVLAVANTPNEEIINHPNNTLERITEVQRVVNFAKRLVAERERAKTGYEQSHQFLPISATLHQGALNASLPSSSPNSAEFKSPVESVDPEMELLAREAAEQKQRDAQKIADDVAWCKFIVDNVGQFVDKNANFFYTGKFTGSGVEATNLNFKFRDLKKGMTDQKYTFHNSTLRTEYGNWIKETPNWINFDTSSAKEMKLNNMYTKSYFLCQQCRQFIADNKVGKGRPSSGKKTHVQTKKNFHIISFR